LNEKDDELLFLDEDYNLNTVNNDKWDILVIDDDQSIHTMTNLALKHKTFESK